MNKYEFRKWNTYEEWFEVEAKSEEEAWEKFRELGEEDRQCQKLAGSESPELYRTTVLDDDDEEEKAEKKFMLEHKNE